MSKSNLPITSSFIFGILLLTTSCSQMQEKNQFINFKVFKFQTEDIPVIGTTFSDQKIKLGGFSGLMFEKSENGEYIFKTITDRGPNGWQIKTDRPFLIPDFSPTIVTIKTNSQNQSLKVIEQIKLKKNNQASLTGLPNHRNEENPVDVFGHMYSVDYNGLDTEGLISDGENGYWVSDEYGPSLVHFNSDGVMLQRFMPGIEIPRVYVERKTNRGFEGIAKFQDKLFGILQSPLPSEQEKNLTRIVEVDTETHRTSAEYYYQLDQQSDRVGDLLALNAHTFIVIEQNGKSGEKSYKKIYLFTIKQSDEIVNKKLLIDLDATPFRQHEKVEGMTIIDQKHIALVNDNDFGITNETNFKTGITPMADMPSELIIIELEKALNETN